MIIDGALVRRLVAAQFPQWADLPVRAVTPGGNDNRTFRLGDALSVRLPSAVGYAPQVDVEQRWLPYLAPHLPLPIPVPVARGVAGGDYPFGWSVYPWLDGATADPAHLPDPTAFAESLAAFLVALSRIDPTGGPSPGRHNGFRGASLTIYDGETRGAIATLGGAIDGPAATAVWETALRASWDGHPVWFHGDVATGNLLVRDGRLSAVIDFGCTGVGDPACDVVIAWSQFAGESRAAFRAALGVDPATWARGRGWALWKALITVVADPSDGSARAVIDRTLSGC